MKNNKGITLISLGVTIVLIFLLATIVITTSIQSLRRMSLENFKYELEEVQRKVDEVVSDYAIYRKTNSSATYENYFTNKFGTSPSLLKNNEEKAEAVILANPILNTNKESDLVFYFTEKDVKQYLGLKGIKDIIVDFSTRYVYSVKGCKDPDNENKIYYSAKDYGESLVVTESSKITSSLSGDSTVTLTASGTNNLVGNTKIYDMKLTIGNRNPNGTDYPITKVYYSKESEAEEIGNTWVEIKDIKVDNDIVDFVLYDEGTYQFKVVDSSGAFKLSNLINVTFDTP